jgi:hypothetical protein
VNWERFSVSEWRRASRAFGGNKRRAIWWRNELESTSLWRGYEDRWVLRRDELCMGAQIEGDREMIAEESGK